MRVVSCAARKGCLRPLFAAVAALLSSIRLTICLQVLRFPIICAVEMCDHKLWGAIVSR